MPLLINKAEVRRELIVRACDAYYWREIVGKDNIRVSADTFEEAEAALDNWMRSYVARLPNKGKTI
jgi:hypothetical protein